MTGTYILEIYPETCCVTENCHQANTTLSLDPCPDFMGSVVGQASFLFHMSQHFLPNLEGISVTETSKLR